MWGSGDVDSNQATSNRRNSSSSNAKGIYRLLGFITFCLLVYKAWGPLLLVTCALAVILHLCYSLHVNDSVFTPYSLVLLGHVRSLGLELAQTLQALLQDGLDKSKVLLEYFKRQYRERFRSQTETAINDSISDAKRNLYRPSGLMNKNSVDNLSPRNNELYQSFASNGIGNIGKTSTPIPRGSNLKKNEMQNGGLNMFTPPNNTLIKKVSSSKIENKPTLDLSQTEDILYSSKNSYWNYSMSPKNKDKSESTRTVQTVAGPLLNSSRYNIDPKLYTDINSPGLSSRLTRYAAEANSKLTHQPQYGAGQFPKVVLNSSPIPILSSKVMKSRMPVTVRVAPPETTNYPPADNSSQQEKSRTYEPMEVRESKSCPSVVQVLKKMAVKRQASREDIMLDFAKKQKADQVYEDQLENLEEMMQKRARDESTTSNDELSPQSSKQRPSKRSKSLSCHDVLHSLSSSTSVFTGTKRKAMDSSRCSSPENEKHFKPSNASTSPTRSSSLTLFTAKELAKSKEQLNVRVSIENASGEPHQNKVYQKSSDNSLDNRLPEKQQVLPATSLNLPTPKIIKEIVFPKEESSFTDKLFMKPEPPANEKLKSLIKEQEKVEAQFKTDDKDEIKKQDIDNMRQNSMRQRLKNMFDAISGNSTSKIDPDVVIQAEEVSSPPTTTASFATLNSLTTTTTVNTSPITTTIVPILKIDAANKSVPASKHVTFNIPASFSSTSSSGSSLSMASNPETTKSSELKASGSLNSNESVAVSTSATSFSFGNKPVTSSMNTSSSVNPTSTGGFSISANSSITTTTPSVSQTETKSLASSSSKTLFSPTSTVGISPTSSGSTNTTGFSFGTTTAAKTTSPTSTISFTPTSTMSSFSFTSPTSSAPSFSFNSNKISSTAPTFSFNSNTSLTSAKSTDSTSTTSTPVLGFGNTLSKSPSSTPFTPTTTPQSTNLNSTPSSMFGTSSTNLPFSINNTATSNATLATSSTTVTSTFNFNTNKSTTSAGFSFNAPTASTPSTTNPAVSTSTFNFATSMQNNANSINGASVFVMPSASSSNSSAPTPAFNSTPLPFNVPANSPSLFSGATTIGSSPMFKSPATTLAPMTSTPSIFSNSPSGFGITPASTAPTTTAPSIFGNTTPTPSLFGNTASITVSTASTNSPFGVPATQSQQQSSIFSGIKTTTTSSSIFGTSTPSTSLFSGVNAGATNPSSSTSPAENSSIFGQPKPFSGTASTFGANNQSSGFSSPSLNNPGSASSSTSAFQTSNTLPTFGKQMTMFGAPSTTSGGSIFGSTNTSTSSVFGSPSITQPAFGPNAPSGTFGAASSSGTFGPTSSSSTFGSSTSAPANIFGSGTAAQTNTFGPSTSAFGSGSSTFGTPNATTSPFGGASTSTQAPSLFGNTPTTSPASGATFSFGGAQTTQQQSGPAFNFSSSSNVSTAGGGGMFQFGGSNDAKPTGFNFNVPTGAPSINFSGSTAPPTFNAPAPNMFSIGSGSSTPRRTSRPRRQR